MNADEVYVMSGHFAGKMPDGVEGALAARKDDMSTRPRVALYRRVGAHLVIAGSRESLDACVREWLPESVAPGIVDDRFAVGEGAIAAEFRGDYDVGVGIGLINPVGAAVGAVLPQSETLTTGIIQGAGTDLAEFSPGIAGLGLNVPETGVPPGFTGVRNLKFQPLTYWLHGRQVTRDEYEPYCPRDLTAPTRAELQRAAERARYPAESILSKTPMPTAGHFDPPVGEPARGYAHLAEALRRERAGKLSTRPQPAQVMDYADGSLKVSQAIHHLDEALPSGQGARAREAFMLLRTGVEELAVWLRSKGIQV